MLLAELDPVLEELDAPLGEVDALLAGELDAFPGELLLLLHAAANSVIAAAQATDAATLGLFISEFLPKFWLRQ
jgi:hypothetical protein